MTFRSGETTFRFDAGAHEYIDAVTGEVLPHITGMLHRAGWIDDQWFTEESCERGVRVHRMTADYDLGALDFPTCVSKYKPYLAGHVAAVALTRPAWTSIEEPAVHPAHRFGGRPDRVGYVYNLKCVWEVKAAIPQRSHQIQTALQAILVAPALGLPAYSVARFVCYLKANGKFRVEEHRNERDFREAEKIIREQCP